jgi:hypothetical protein
MQTVIKKFGGRRHFIVGVLASILGLSSLIQLMPAPAYAASNVTLNWKDATTLVATGGAFKSPPVTFSGDFVANVYGTPTGSQTFMSNVNNVATSFGCTTYFDVNIYPDSSGNLDFSKGQIIFVADNSSQCSLDQLKSGIPGLAPDPTGGTADLSMNIAIGNVAARGSSNNGGGKAVTVKVIAGMGPASDYTNLPNTDTFILCQSTGAYANNKDQLDKDCMAKKSGVATKALTSDALATLQDGQGPNGGDEKAWQGTFTNVTAPANWDVCSVNFNACQFFPTASGQDLTVTIDWGGAPNPKIPGDPPSSDATIQEPQLGCDLSFDLTTIFSLKWLVCPIVNAATFTVGKLEDTINSLLTVDTKDIFNDTATTNAYHTAWNSFRVFALGLIVVAALIMVVSQAAGVELLDAYTIRKVLPRLLFAAIFITLSWDILELLCNLSNDAGTGIRTLIYAPFQALIKNGNSQLGGGSSFVLTLIGTGGALAFGWIGLLSFALTGMLAALVAFAVLVFRKMLILLLIMMAPFAIACYILPSTLKGWTIWKDGLLSALIVFPIISAMIAIGRVFSVTAFNAQSYNGPGGQTVSQIIAVIAYFAPYFLISMAFRLAGGFIATVGGVVNDRGRGAFDRLKNFRGNKVNDNMSKMASGRRFQNSNPLARGFNAASGGVGTFAKSRSKFGFLTDKNIRDAAFAQQRNLNQMAYAGSDSAKVAADNDPLLRAQTYASAAEARANMVKDFDMYEKNGDGSYKLDSNNNRIAKTADMESAIAAAKANGGFGRDQQVYAARRLFSTGTGYDNLRQVHETAARVAGQNEEMASDLLGFGNAETGNKGRLDLKAGYTTQMKLYRSIAANGSLSEAELDSATMDAVKGNEVLSMMRGKPIAMKNVTPVIQKSLEAAQITMNDTSKSQVDRDAAAQEAAKLSGIIEQFQQNGTYASPINVQTTDEVLVQPTLNIRQDVQQQASRTVLERNPTTGRMEQVTNLSDLQRQLRQARAAGNAAAEQNALQEIQRHQQEGTLNQGLVNNNHNEDMERGYQQQRPRGMYDPNDPRFGG